MIPRNTTINGDCIDVMQTLPARSVDFILTDPPYITSYRSRNNQTLRNDDNAAWLAPSFAAMYRVPKDPLPDVIDWTYTGNKHHPTQKSIHILKPLIEAFTKPGDLVLDPFAGSGSTCAAAHRAGRGYIGIELDPEHHQTATARLADSEAPTAA